MLVSFVVAVSIARRPSKYVIPRLRLRCRATSRGSAGPAAISARAAAPPRRSRRGQFQYRRARARSGLVESLEQQFGFDKPADEHLHHALDYVRFDLASYFRDVSVLHLIAEKLPVSISLGVWMDAAELSDLIRSALARRCVTVRSSISACGVIIVGYAIRILFAICSIILLRAARFFQLFPLPASYPLARRDFPSWQNTRSLASGLADRLESA